MIRFRAAITNMNTVNPIPIGLEECNNGISYGVARLITNEITYNSMILAVKLVTILLNVGVGLRIRIAYRRYIETKIANVPIIACITIPGKKYSITVDIAPIKTPSTMEYVIINGAGFFGRVLYMTNMRINPHITPPIANADNNPMLPFAKAVREYAEVNRAEITVNPRRIPIFCIAPSYVITSLPEIFEKNLSLITGFELLLYLIALTNVNRCSFVNVRTDYCVVKPVVGSIHQVVQWSNLGLNMC